jgi:hypothetical protein
MELARQAREILFCPHLDPPNTAADGLSLLFNFFVSMA